MIITERHPFTGNMSIFFKGNEIWCTVNIVFHNSLQKTALDWKVIKLNVQLQRKADRNRMNPVYVQATYNSPELLEVKYLV